MPGWYQKRDEQRGIGLGPEHDWSSHSADSFGLMCVAYEEPQQPKAAVTNHFLDGLMSDKDTLAEALEHFKLSEEAEASGDRKAWIDDVRFCPLGEQWPDGVKRQREIDGRPCLTINRMPAMLRQVVNDARQNKPAIKVHPVDSGAKARDGEILNGLIRNIEYTSNADVAYDTALDHAVTGGFGYFRIDVDYACDDEFDLDIKICRIANPLTVYGDENSTAADSSDWNKAFITELYTEREFEKRWKGAEIQLGISYRDLPDGWRDNELVRVAEWWTREKCPPSS